MSHQKKSIILKNTVRHLQSSNDYQWGHMGACNCGFLAQQISHLDKKEIHRRAMQGHGDWNEQLNDYCANSGLLIDDLITELVSAGFSIDELKHLERLSDPTILKQFAWSEKSLQHNCKDDVIEYMKIWYTMLESKPDNDYQRELVELELVLA